MPQQSEKNPKPSASSENYFRGNDARKDLESVLEFIFDASLSSSLFQRINLIRRYLQISRNIESLHTQHEVVSFVHEVCALPSDIQGCIVEAGVFKGGATTKLSLAARLVGRDLVVFDSFSGIPTVRESNDTNIFGGPAVFPSGSYHGSLSEVRANIENFGDVDACQFVEGLFESTLPLFNEKIAAAFLDVDLASSTATCLKYFYPLLSPGGILFSQDGHLKSVVRIISDREFWEREAGVARPEISGLGETKLLRIKKTSKQPQILS